MGRHRKTPKQQKHKKLKNIDPMCYGTRRNQHLTRSNSKATPPNKNEEEKMPRKLREMIDAKNVIDKEGKKNLLKLPSSALMSKAKRKEVSQNDESTPTKKFKRRKNESHWQFIQRMTRATQEAIAKSSIEVKFGVKLQDVGDGKVVAVKDEQALNNPKASGWKSKLGKRKNETPNKTGNETSEKLAPGSALRKARRRWREIEKMDDNDEKSLLTDEVEFGEYVEAPPKLNVPKMKNKLGSITKPYSFISSSKSMKNMSASFRSLNKKMKMTKSTGSIRNAEDMRSIMEE